MSKGEMESFDKNNFVSILKRLEMRKLMGCHYYCCVDCVFRWTCRDRGLEFAGDDRPGCGRRGDTLNPALATPPLPV